MSKEFTDKIQRFLFFATLLFLPTQFGKHFWPSFSYIGGIRVDYLSPTVYITDILVCLLFMIWQINVWRKFRTKSQISNLKSQKKLIIFFVGIIAFLTIGILLSKNPSAGFYGLAKFLEFLFFGFYTANQKNVISFAIPAFCFGLIYESVLAIAQYINQGSIGGLMYFIGERFFTGQTPGVANASLNGRLVLRPYGTLPHPNVLAGYLLIGILLLFSYCLQKKQRLIKRFFYVAIIFGSIALLLTMSRIVIFLYAVIFALFIIISIKNKLFLKSNYKVIPFIAAVLLLILFFIEFPIASRFTALSLSDESIVERWELVFASIQMLKQHILFGVGLNNFWSNLYFFLQPKHTFFLQPVHNIFLLTLSETGVVGFVFLLWFLKKIYDRIREKEVKIENKNFIIHNTKYIILTTVFVLGFFDHYFFTVQQGQLLFAFLFGFLWSF